MKITGVEAIPFHIPHNNCAKAAVDIGLHNLMGKSMSLPVYKLLGGKSRDTVFLSWMVGIDPKEKMAKECEKFLGPGIEIDEKSLDKFRI